jgi:hypothetical protein
VALETKRAEVTRGVRTAVVRETDKSGANAQLVVATERGAVRRLLAVLVRYSAAPTQAGVTVKVDSGAGADWDTPLFTGSANAQNTVYLPDAEVLILPDDAIEVTAPAGGGVITSAISVYTEAY